jgi:hypothetical protein
MPQIIALVPMRYGRIVGLPSNTGELLGKSTLRVPSAGRMEHTLRGDVLPVP